MLKIQRQHYIEEELHRTGSIIISEISAALSCSEETIRRDLKEMEGKGQLKRIHGGAFLPDTEDKGAPARLRELCIPETKKTIARLALQEAIRDNDLIFLDSSTTCLTLARLILTRKLPITVITNSLNIIALFDGASKETAFIAIGGKYRRRSRSFVGELAVSAIKGFHADAAFISCSAVDRQLGLLDNSEHECRIRQKMMLHSKKRYLLMDHTKFSDSGDYIISDFSSVTGVITDRPPGKDWEEIFSRHGISLSCEGDYARTS